MRKNENKLRVVADAHLPSAKRTDRSGSLSESQHVRRSRKGAPELTLAEIRSIEARVRKELYP